MRFGRLRVLRIEGIVPATSPAWGLGYTVHSFNGVSRKAVLAVTTQLELEARYAGVVSAKAAAFVYADHVASLCAHSGVMGSGDVLIDMIGGAGLRVADVRSVAADVHDAGGRLFADITVPSHFGCHAFDLGVDVQLEALDRIAAGRLSRKVVAVSSRGVLPVAGDRLSAADLDAIAQGLDSAPERMQRHFDHARALAEYLSCCEGLGLVAYPGLPCHPIMTWQLGSSCTALARLSISSFRSSGALRRGSSSSVANSTGEPVPPVGVTPASMRAMGRMVGRFAYLPVSTTLL